MAEILRHPAPASPNARPAAAPQYRGRSGAARRLLLDNRLVEDVQLKLRADHFFEPLHGRIYEAILRLTDRNMIANPSR
jgi:replicative DNA helicase